jgi:hypothetical protein
MQTTFNALLVQAGLDLRDVRLIRHANTTKKYLNGHTPYELWRDSRQEFETFQGAQTQHFRTRLDASHWASFVITPDERTLFVGVYAVTNRTPLAPGDWDPSFGVRLEGVAYDVYDLTLMDKLLDQIGELYVDWGGAPRVWIQRAHQQDKPIIEMRVSLPTLRAIDPPPATRPGNDLSSPPDRIAVTTYRILRDTELSRGVKRLHNYECQICGHRIELPDGSHYAESHHIQPLGAPHNGPDVIGNVLCLCPNHHAELDLGVMRIEYAALRGCEGHTVDPKYIEYHDRRFFDDADEAL